MSSQGEDIDKERGREDIRGGGSNSETDDET